MSVGSAAGAAATEVPKYDELPVIDGAPPWSSWGLWGVDDQFGCLNLLSPSRVLDAASSISLGQVIALNASLFPFEAPLFGRPAVQHRIEVANRGRARDDVLSEFNTQCSSQWDGLKHACHSHYGFYNGLEESALSISTWAASGIVGRGVLLDLETSRSEAGAALRYDDSDPISVEDLRAAACGQGVEIGVGDILIVHTGWLGHAQQSGQQPPATGMRTPGLRPGRRMLEHLWNSHVAAVASDTPAVEVWPPGAFTTREQRRADQDQPLKMVDTFMHGELLALLGMPLGELWDTAELAAECRAQGRWEFLLASAPLNLPAGAGSPANAVAIL